MMGTVWDSLEQSDKEETSPVWGESLRQETNNQIIEAERPE